MKHQQSAPTPALVSQLTCLQVAALDPRRYREFVNAHHVRCARVGKLLLVRVDDLMAALDLADEQTFTEAEGEPAPTENRVLRLLGREAAR